MLDLSLAVGEGGDGTACKRVSTGRAVAMASALKKCDGDMDEKQVGGRGVAGGSSCDSWSCSLGGRASSEGEQ